MEEVKNQNLWNLASSSQENLNDPIWITLGFQQRDRQDSQNLSNVTLCRLAVTSGQCKIGTEKYPDAGIILIYDDDEYSQGYSQIKEVFRALTEDDILQPYISLEYFRSSKTRADDVGGKLYVFDSRYQQNFDAHNQLK